MIDDMPVIDAVVHPYNLADDNHRYDTARWITDLVSKANRFNSPPGYRLTKDAYERDWPIEDVANMTFVESHADLAAYHVVPIRAYHDGICSVEKGLEARERWPDRFIFYVGVDPLEGSKAIEDLEMQVEAFGGDAVGLKLYPNSWAAGEVTGWLMDDPEVAFPVLQRAADLGLGVAAIHKALPLGPVELKHYRVDDIDRAAMAFPQLNFEIVHGGFSFVEETAWQIARFDNVWVNLETTATMATTRPRAFHEVMAGLIRSEKSLSRVLWGTGCMVSHPRPHVESFAAFQWDPALTDTGTRPAMTEADKRKIFAENYAALHGIDLESRLDKVRGDEFDVARREAAGMPEPYSLTGAAGQAS